METISVELDCHDLDESQYQRIISKQYKTHHSYYTYNTHDIEKSLIKCIWMYDYPLHHPNIIPSYLMNVLARKKNLKVLLGGHGADELFVGYAWNFDTDTFNPRKDKIIESNFFTPFELNDKIFKGGNTNLTARHKLTQDINDSHIATSLLDQRCYLDKWLHRQDRAGMYASIEIRVPYCNIEIFKLVNSISFDNKTLKGQTPKYLLKTIAEKYLDPSIVCRKKVGFGIPLEDWFRDYSKLGQWCKPINTIY
jgi:asparagine synthase (glutamine-hydrolysing)